MRSLFIRLFFRDSTGCVNYRARGCTLSSVRSWRLLRKRRASDSHDTFKNTRTHINCDPASETSQSVSQSASQLLGDIPVSSSTTQLQLTHKHTGGGFFFLSYLGGVCARRELIWRHFSSQSEPRERTGEDVERRSSGRSSMKLFVCVCRRERSTALWDDDRLPLRPHLGF